MTLPAYLPPLSVVLVKEGENPSFDEFSSVYLSFIEKGDYEKADNYFILFYTLFVGRGERHFDDLLRSLFSKSYDDEKIGNTGLHLLNHQIESEYIIITTYGALNRLKDQRAEQIKAKHPWLTDQLLHLDSSIFEQGLF